MSEQAPLTISSSTVKKFRRCKRQYYYAVVEGLEPRIPDPKLKLGSWFHDLMKAYYREEDWRAEHKRQLKWFNNLLKEERDIYGDLPQQAERMMESYLWNYREDHENWETLYVEENFEVHFAGGDTYSFKPDLIIRDKSKTGKGIWVVDHKTTKGIPPAEWRLEDLQSTLYPWALKEGMGLEVRGFIFNYIRKKPPTVPHINKDGSISKRRIDTDFTTMAKFLLRYYEVSSLNKLPVEWKKRLKVLQAEKKYFRRVRIDKLNREPELVKRQVSELSFTAQEIETWHEIAEQDGIDPWVRTALPSCAWDCDFTDLCALELMGQNTNFIRRAKFQPSKYGKGRGLGRGK